LWFSLKWYRSLRGDGVKARTRGGLDDFLEWQQRLESQKQDFTGLWDVDLRDEFLALPTVPNGDVIS